jgi:uncharacterized protein YpbB
MSRLTLRLPDSLHRQLEELANHEAVSLNQYIVYALTRQTTLAYTLQAVPERAIAEQRAAYTALLQSLGETSSQHIQEALAERESVPAEEGLSPEVVDRLRQRMKEKSKQRA